MTRSSASVRSEVGFSARRVLLVAASGLCISLSGCKVGPDYRPPEVAVPPNWTEQPETQPVDGEPGSDAAAGTVGEPAPVASALEPAWWRSLNDPVLERLVADAVSANHDLLIASERIIEARAARGIAAAAGLPSVDASGAYSRSRQSERTSGGRFIGDEDSSGTDHYSAGLDASWEIDVFGGVARSVEAAEADIQSLEENRRDVMVILAAEVARNYVDLRGFQQRIEVTRRNIQIQSDTLALTESRFAAGLTSELDVAQARAQLEQTRSTLPPLDEAARAAIHRLGVLLGSEPGALLAELATPAPIPAPPATFAIGLPSDLVRRRPDVRRVERQLAAQTARIGVATADLFPRFSLTGAFGFESEHIGDLGSGDSRFWSIGPAVRWPIFRGGAIRSNIRVQESRARQVLLTYEQTILRAFEDVENALVSLSRARARRAALSDAVIANRRAVELSDTLNRAGLVDFQRVLSSQQSLALSEEQLAASDQAVMQATIRLYRALGGGWEVLEPATIAESANTQAPERP